MSSIPGIPLVPDEERARTPSSDYDRAEELAQGLRSPAANPQIFRSLSERSTQSGGTSRTELTHPGRLSVVALALGERIDVPRLGGKRLGSGQVLIDVGSAGHAIVFRYGCAVLFDVTADEQRLFTEQIQDFVTEPFRQPDTEGAQFGVGGNWTTEGEVMIADRSVECLQVVADVLAKSVALAHYEAGIAGAFDRVEPLVVELEKRGRVDRRHASLVRHIASALLTQQRMVGRFEVTEKPDVLWDRPDLERLFARMVDEYELKDRAVALERKLTLVSRTGEVFLNLLYDRRSLRVEWYIVVLIVVEILITIWTLVFMPR